jgi:ATP-binding protein involved in chromosome partitioning
VTALSKDAVRSALEKVLDPELGRDLVSLGMVKEITVTGDEVAVTVELTTPACPLRQQIGRDVEAAVRAAGARTVKVEFTANVAARRTPERARLPGVKHVIAVASGKGGVGKSTVAVNLALALKAHGSAVGILDADVYGPSVPQMMGPATTPARAMDEGHITPAVHHGVTVISVGFFVERGGAVVWRGPMVHKLLQQFVEEVDWGTLDYLIVDLPPGTGDAQLSIAQLVPLSGAVMVTTPQEVAVIDVVKGCAMFTKVDVPILGVIENMSGYVCPQCGHHDHIFAAGGGRRLAAEVGAPFLGEIPIDGSVARGGDAGVPVVAGAPAGAHARIFMDLAATLAGRISQQVLTPRQPPDLHVVA